MSSRVPIGEILLVREALDPWVLSQAILDQPASRMRLVSLLISRALIDSDDGSLALSVQSQYPGAMERHLERRDPAVVDTISADVARRWVVLPIGRSRRRGLVVVAREPTPILGASLEHMTKMQVELAVAPALHLERLVRSLYGELEPDPSPPLPSQPLRSITDLSLDSRDVLPRPARTVSRSMLDTSPDLPARSAPSITQELDGTLEQIERAINRASAEHHAMMFASRRWHASLLVTVSEGLLLGRRGHGAKLGSVDAIILPSDAPSILQIAYTTRTATAIVPDGAVQRRLSELLGNARAPAAAPILVDGKPVAVFAVGDTSTHELKNPMVKLAALADALGSAYERLPH
ncbi:MAG: hypothetical protein H0T42_18840 [Deltaproteobacteria bacterium]|nr:hypothetical protein [Deltaproteobacteria bacterium]